MALDDLPPDADTGATDGGTGAITYVGPGELPGTHVVTDGQGNQQTTSFDGLPDSVKVDAINQAAGGAQPQTGNMPGTWLDRGLASVLAPDAAAGLGLNPDGSRTIAATPGNSGGADTAPAPAPEAGTTIPPAVPGPDMAPSTDAVLGKSAGGGGGGGRGPNLNGELDQAKTDRMAAANTQYERDKSLAQQQTDLGHAQSYDQGQRVADFQQTQQQIQDLGMAALQKASDATDDFLHSSIQPFHQDIGNRLLSAVTMMAGGFGAGVAHQDNLAAKAYTDTINQDLERQKFNIEHKKEASEAYQSLFQKYTELGLSNRQAFDATDLALTKKAKQDMDNLVLAHGGQQALATYESQAGTIHQDIAEKQAALAQSTATTNNLRAEAAEHYANAGKIKQSAQTASFDRAAQQLAASGQAIPPQIIAGMSPDARKSITGDRHLETSPDKATKIDDINESASEADAALANAIKVNQDSSASFGDRQAALADAHAAIAKHLGAARATGANIDQDNSIAEIANPRSRWNVANYIPGNEGRIVQRLQEGRNAIGRTKEAGVAALRGGASSLPKSLKPKASSG